jgi:hypothetical protein
MEWEETSSFADKRIEITEESDTLMREDIGPNCMMNGHYQTSLER